MTAAGWTVHPSGETAVGSPVPVIAEGDVFAQVTPIWSDTDGVRVSIDWARSSCGGIDGVEDLSAAQAVALADALREVAGMAPPDA